MQRKTIGQLVIAASMGVAALFASDVWKSKDYTQWTYEEANKVLTDSPWAKQKSVSFQPGAQNQRRSGGGMGGLWWGRPG